MNPTPILFACSFIFVLSSCRDQNPSGEVTMPAPQVEVVEALPDKLMIKTRIPGRLEPYLQAEVRARVTGIVLDRTYEEGQQVKEGDALFKIDPAPLQAILDASNANLDRAKATLKDAQDKAARYRDLLPKGLVSGRENTLAIAEMERAQAEYNAALANREQAIQELSYTTVTSPIDGRVRRALVTKGALANKNEFTKLTTVEQINPIYALFSAPASIISKLRQSIRSGKWDNIPQKEIQVQLILPDGSEYPHKGKLVFSDMAVDPQTDTIEMRAEFENPQMELLPGTYVRISYDSAVHKNIYRIPRDSVTMTSGGGAMVLIVNKDMILEPRPIKIDKLDGKNWIVTEGLTPGDKVVTAKPGRTFPGMKVSIVDSLSGEAVR